MGIIAYHGTDALDEILRTRMLGCFMANLNFDERMRAHLRESYLSMVSGLAAVIKTALTKDELKKCEFDVLLIGEGKTLADVTDEMLADFTRSCQDISGMYQRYFEYRERRRITHVWLGSYALAASCAHKENTSAVLKFDIPPEKLRPSLLGDCKLVWWELRLDHLTKIYARDPNRAAMLIKEYKYETPIEKMK